VWTALYVIAPTLHIGGVAEHREIWQKKQQGKLKTTAVAPMVREEADDQYCGTFQVQE
jgi:hypothetical protein